MAAEGAYWRLYEAQQRQAEAETVLGGGIEKKVLA
jgi:ATP-binding cassette subfamily B protein